MILKAKLDSLAKSVEASSLVPSHTELLQLALLEPQVLVKLSQQLKHQKVWSREQVLMLLKTLLEDCRSMRSKQQE
jgi:predicted nucleic-acid-binding protein